MKEQTIFRCTIMRGGTSKAVFLKENELPRDPALREKNILGIFGSPDVRQIDGLGGSDITTSKVAIIGPPTRDDADIDYTFGQVQLTRPEVVWSSNCGNISSAVGPYAIDEGMVKVQEPFTTVRIHNTNTNKVLIAKVEVREGCAAVAGDFVLDSVPGTGAKIELDYRLTYGSVTGKLLPTGHVVDELEVEGIGTVPVSIVDIANSVCFVNASSLGLTGKEARPQILADPDLLQRIEKIRSAAAVAMGLVKPGECATEKSPIQPMLSFVSPAADYQDYASGAVIHKDEVDFLARIMFNQMPVETYTGTGTICTSVAAMIEGTLVNQVCSPRAKQEKNVRFGHARGINTIDVEVSQEEDGSFHVEKAVFNRTARRILDGLVYVKNERIE